MTIKTHSDERRTADVQAVQVVDAATLLASIENGDQPDIETEIMMAPSSVVDREGLRESSDEAAVAEVSQVSKVHPVGDAPSSISEPIFSPHDLASIAWSSTELRDTLRVNIVGMAVNLIASVGRSATDRMTGADLSNLQS